MVDSGDEFATRLQAGPTSTRTPRGGWGLLVVAGPDIGKRVTMDGRSLPHVLVGTSPICDLQLTDALVSRRHLALDVGEMLRVSDLKSTNGTYVNGVRIERAFLRGGEALRIGDSELRLVPAPELPAPEQVNATMFGTVLGASAQMRRLYPAMSRLSASDVPLIIEGETGTGKEVVAESIHAASAREKGPFSVFDCTTIPGSLFEAELFGHERGAFTGALSTRKGLFEEAEGGTLFIDEIGDLDLAMQSRLLRALDHREVRRVGGNKWIKVDVRLIAATRRDLDRLVQEGRFRDDLFYRLAVGRLELPPLRDREGDVAFLGEVFWRALGGDAGGPPPHVVERWRDYAWPGNVRELYNAVLRAVSLGDEPVAALSPVTSSSSGEGAGVNATIDDVIARALPFAQARKVVHEEFVRRYIAVVLARHNGNVSNAATASGLARRYFQILRSGRR